MFSAFHPFASIVSTGAESVSRLSAASASEGEKMTSFIYIQDLTKTSANEYNQRVNIKFGGDVSNVKFMRKLDEVLKLFKIKEKEKTDHLHSITPTNGETGYRLCSGKISLEAIDVERLEETLDALPVYGFVRNWLRIQASEPLYSSDEDLSKVEDYDPGLVYRTVSPYSDFEECFLWVDNIELETKLHQLKDLKIYTSRPLNFESFFFVNKNALYKRKDRIERYHANFYPVRQGDKDHHFNLYVFGMPVRKRTRTPSPEPSSREGSPSP
jgi:hypothetical protein